MDRRDLIALGASSVLAWSLDASGAPKGKGSGSNSKMSKVKLVKKASPLTDAERSSGLKAMTAKTYELAGPARLSAKHPFSGVHYLRTQWAESDPVATTS